MMTRRAPLPASLGVGAFTTDDSRAVGVTRGRLRGRDLAHPHRGVYLAREEAPDFVSRCRSLLPVLGPAHVFTGATAATLWGMPMPGIEPTRIDVLTIGTGAPIRRRGVRGARTSDDRVRRVWIEDLPVTTPADTWCALAAGPDRVNEAWLVAIADSVISGRRGERGRTRPLATRAELADAVARREGQRGARVLRDALELVRSPVDSPRETFLRLVIMAAGLPEPHVQVRVETTDGPRHADLGWPEHRLLLEYQGDEHRISRRRWLADLTRIQLFEDAGYRVILVGAADLDEDAVAVVARIRRALARDDTPARSIGPGTVR